MFDKMRLCVLALIVFFPGTALSKEPDLAGHWYETNNYPASSIIKFKRVNDIWVGHYVQVSVLQKTYGFTEGEAIIRGSILGDMFKGEVLLKWSPNVLENCQNIGHASYWAPIEMKLIDPGKLYGAWLQGEFDPEQGCAITSIHWQTYGLERLKLMQ